MIDLGRARFPGRWSVHEMPSLEADRGGSILLSGGGRLVEYGVGPLPHQLELCCSSARGGLWWSSMNQNNVVVPIDVVWRELGTPR